MARLVARNRRGKAIARGVTGPEFAAEVREWLDKHPTSWARIEDADTHQHVGTMRGDKVERYGERG